MANSNKPNVQVVKVRVVSADLVPSIERTVAAMEAELAEAQRMHLFNQQENLQGKLNLARMALQRARQRAAAQSAADTLAKMKTRTR